MPLSDIQELLDPSTDETVGLPDVICIEPIHTCNLRCIMCHVSYSPISKTRLDVDELLRHMKGVKEGTVVVIGWSFEPVAHPDFAKLVNGLSDLGCRIDLTTNGTLMTDKVINKVKDANFRFVAISFDGIRKDTYEYIRKRANYDRAVKRITNFRDALRGRPVQFQLNYVTMRSNLGELIEAVDFWNERDFDIIYFFMTRMRSDHPVVMAETLDGHMDEVNAAFESLAEDVLRRKRRIRVKAQPFSFQPLRERFGNGRVFDAGHSFAPYKHGFRLANARQPGLPVPCTAAHTMLSVWYDGRVTLCNELTVGNINSDGALFDIFNGAPARNLRHALRKNPQNCLSCDFFKSCIRGVNDDELDAKVHLRGGSYQHPAVVDSDDTTTYVQWVDDFYAVPKFHRNLPNGLEADLAVRYADHKKGNITRGRSLEALRAARAAIPLDRLLETEVDQDKPFLPPAYVRGHKQGLLDVFLINILSQLRNTEEPTSVLLVGNGVGSVLLTVAATLDHISTRTNEVYVLRDARRSAGPGRKHDLQTDVLYHHNERVARRHNIHLKEVTDLTVLAESGERQFDLVFISENLDYGSLRREIGDCAALVRSGGFLAGVGSEKQAYEVSDGKSTAYPIEQVGRDPKTGLVHHPGVTAAVAQSLGRVFSRHGFWAVKKNAYGFEAEIVDGRIEFLPPHVQEARKRAHSGLGEVSQVFDVSAVAADTEIFVYGASDHGQAVRTHIKSQLDRDVDSFVDGYKRGRLDGLPIMSRAQLAKKYNGDALIVVASSGWPAIVSGLEQDGLDRYLVSWSRDDLLLVRPKDKPLFPSAIA